MGGIKTLLSEVKLVGTVKENNKSNFVIVYVTEVHEKKGKKVQKYKYQKAPENGYICFIMLALSKLIAQQNWNVRTTNKIIKKSQP